MKNSGNEVKESLKTKEERSKNEPKIGLNEAKSEAKKSKNSAIYAKRSEDPQSKGKGFNEPQGGYMNGGPC